MTIPFAITAAVIAFACVSVVVGWNEFIDQREWATGFHHGPVRVIGWIVIVSFFTWFFCLIGDRV
jgi:hypothetical protein